MVYTAIQFNLEQELEQANLYTGEQRVAALLAASRKLRDYCRGDNAAGLEAFKRLANPLAHEILNLPSPAIQANINHLITEAGHFGITREQIATYVRELVEYRKRRLLEQAQQQSEPWQQPAAGPITRATPQTLVRNGSTALTRAAAPGAIARPDIPLGESIEEVFAQYGHPGVKYKPHELGENSRFYKLVFSWKAGDSPDKIKKRRYELALVGLNPEEIRIVIGQGVRLEDETPEGRFEVHIPKATWTPTLLLNWLYESSGGPREIRGAVERLNWLVYNSPKAVPGEPLQTALGLDLQNQPVWIEHKKGVFSVGSPDSGKSASLRARAVHALLRHTPETLVIYAIDLKQVTFMPFEGLIHLITNAEVIPQFLKNLLEENKKRNEMFARAGVTDILQYNEAFPDHAIPMIWVIWDEPNHTRRESKDPAEISRATEELTGLTRSTGIYWDISTQYPTKDYAVSPATRNNLSEKVLFQCTEAAADLVLETNGSSELASSLLGDGDALVKVASCRRRITRVQSFFVPDKPRENLLYLVLTEMREAVLQGDRPKLPETTLIPSSNPKAGVVSNSPSGSEEDPWGSDTDAIEKTKWLLIQKVERYNQANSSNKISNRRLYAAIIGDRFLSEEQQRNYQVESLQDLINQPQLSNDDPRAKAYTNGGNEQTARRYIEELRTRYGGSK